MWTHGVLLVLVYAVATVVLVGVGDLLADDVAVLVLAHGGPFRLHQ